MFRRLQIGSLPITILAANKKESEVLVGTYILGVVIFGVLLCCEINLNGLVIDEQGYIG